MEDEDALSCEIFARTVPGGGVPPGTTALNRRVEGEAVGVAIYNPTAFSLTTTTTLLLGRLFLFAVVSSVCPRPCQRLVSNFASRVRANNRSITVAR
jgi:hypothetical protein